jgi:hypothetical protein
MPSDTYRIDFDELKRSVSMEQVVAFLAIPGLKQRGARQWKGQCPFCKGLDCFVVSNDGGRDKTGAFNCFKCPAGGDQIELVSLSRGHPRRDRDGAFAAAKELHAKFVTASGGESGNGNGGSNAKGNSSPHPNRERRAGFDPDAYAKSLDPAHEALAGLGVDPETLRQWKAGYASTGVNRGRLALPIAGKDGATIGYFGRATKGESPTLTFPNGLNPQEHIFGADRVTSDPLALVRDPLDVLKAFEAGCGNAVCFLTEDVAAIQLEALAALMDERKCESVSFF